MGIGQGYVNVNALQLCVMASRLANGSRALQPRLIHSIGGVVQPSGAQAPELPFAKEHIDFVREAMGAVVNDGGTAALYAQLGLGPVKMAGKTGTAQAHNYSGGGHGAHGAQGAWAQRDHAWFIAFAPYDAPRYAMSVLVEHGGFGAEAAAPKAREIMRVALAQGSGDARAHRTAACLCPPCLQPRPDAARRRAPSRRRPPTPLPGNPRT